MKTPVKAVGVITVKENDKEQTYMCLAYDEKFKRAVVVKEDNKLDYIENVDFIFSYIH